MPRSHRFLLLALALGSVLLTALARHHGFFWDAVLQASRYAQWYYQHGLQRPVLPAEFDAGHPPLFGLALAGVWRLFGPSVAVSHWAMLPLVLGTLWQLYRLVRRFLPAAWVLPGLLLVWLDATWLAQSTLVSPDVAVTFCYLLALNGLLARRPGQTAAGTAPLVLLSTRGLLLWAALGLTALLLRWPEWWPRRAAEGKRRFDLTVRTLLALIWPLLPALLLAAGWLGLHYCLTGWVGYNPDSPWAGNYQRLGPAGVLRNVVIIGWRLVDNGRLTLWLVGAVAAGLLWRGGWRPGPRTGQLLALWLPPVLIMSGLMVWYANPIGHRYYLPALLLLALLVAHLLAELAALPRPSARGLPRILAALALLGLLSGHCWVYPDRIANGWDASLAHWPYFRLRQQSIAWLDAQGIPLGTVGSSFPNAYPLHDVDLTGDARRFAPVDLRRNRYVLQSNVMNFGDAALDSLQQYWHLRHEERAGQVYFRLYEVRGDR
ncbi:hypothetical protein EJV47_26815 [Hymenobacter gummosus]|uniref:Glycosyltransferase RgtA/B/C/D-like domain-containing protein n=1 Tax=Hymenobacter gummosus TaxID=1776032 RepID=A0A431TUS7_9BACT|nr:hypothetical protein [Hymenobacter gummosus]RTQ44983.1 hypothetical protein EJV47_26815 [Hymenobacter gummosus]